MAKQDQNNGSSDKVVSFAAHKLQKIEHKMSYFIKELQSLLEDGAKKKKPKKNNETISLVVDKKTDDDEDKT